MWRLPGKEYPLHVEEPEKGIFVFALDQIA